LSLVFDVLKTGIDGLDAILGGGIRYPAEDAAFLFVSGGPGTGKTLLGLEMVTRAWLHGDDGSTYLYYSVEHPPDNLFVKLQSDFEFYRCKAEITALPREVNHKLCLEAKTAHGTSRLILTHANPASMGPADHRGRSVDVEWILAEIGNYKLAGPVRMVCLDNIGLLLTDLEYFEKRKALLETRRALLKAKIHGIFVQEEAEPRSLRSPTAEEFSTDVLIHLGSSETGTNFKARTIEIQKARHQYYYRGSHHFSIAGRGITRDVYLGARNERGPGMHIYPSVAAQLSIARDQAAFRVPKRGETPIDMGHPAINRAFLNGTGPGQLSSTVVLCEPGTRSTYAALRFLAAGANAGENTLMVSTREDRDAIHIMCKRDPELGPACLKDDRSGFAKGFRVLYLHPEFISPGKFAWDIVRTAGGGHGGHPVARLAFDNVHQLQHRFPLLTNQEFMVPALLDLLRYKGVTPMFLDLAPPGSGLPGSNFDPSRYTTTFDNVFHLGLDRSGPKPRVHLRILKSMGNDFDEGVVPL